MLTESEIKRFYEYVGSLGLKFPVAALAKETGFSKGQVSDYLKKKKDPSENFINAVYEKFPVSSTIVPREKPPDPRRGHRIRLPQSHPGPYRK